jgi:phosphoribosylformimino-5-aminoimidazole carboxamide ribotide isomerase
MDLYPAIDLRHGRVVRLRQGDFADETVYGDDPIAVAKEFEAAGARWIHVVDLDSARGDGSNRDVVVALAQSVSVSVQTGGGVRDGSLLDAGLARIVVGSMAVADPQATGALIAAYPGQVAVGLDHRDGQLLTRGWEEHSGRAVVDVAAELASPDLAAFIVTDVSRDAMLQGPDVDGLSALAADTPVPVIASGGVSSLDDLRALRATPVAGAIVGKALYENRFTVSEALAVG